MKTYDYRDTNGYTQELSKLADCVSTSEAKAALNAIKDQQERQFAMKQDNFSTWFTTALLPLLQDFAEMTSSCLDIDSPSTNTIFATFINDYGFDITETCHTMRSLLILSSNIGITYQDNAIALTLVFESSAIL